MNRMPLICPTHRHAMEDDGKRWVCGEPGCDMVAWKGSTSTPANKETRTARSHAHMIFDPIWKAGTMSRDEAYDRMADYMNLDTDVCHIGMFDLEQCRRVGHFVTDLFCDVGFDDLSRIEVRKMSLLEKVAPSRRNRPPRIVLTGTEKIGKSTFASGFAKPIFIPIDKEEGIDDVDADAFPVARSFDELLACVQTLIDEPHSFKTLAIDSASTLSPLIMAEALKIEGVSEEKKLGGGYGREYNTAILLWSRLLDGLDKLRDRGMTTILISHIVKAQFDDPINGNYTQFEIDLPKKITPLIKRWADSILFANWEVYRTSESAGFNKELHRGAGSGRRMLFTQGRPAHPGGGRGVYGELPYEISFTAESFRGAVIDRLNQRKAESATTEPTTELATA